jgi:hypothetical protein
MLTAPTDATAEPTIITRVLALIHRPAMGGRLWRAEDGLVVQWRGGGVGGVRSTRGGVLGSERVWEVRLSGAGRCSGVLW